MNDRQMMKTPDGSIAKKRGRKKKEQTVEYDPDSFPSNNADELMHLHGTTSFDMTHRMWKLNRRPGVTDELHQWG